MSSEICRVESVTVKDHAVFVDAQHLSRPSVEYRNTPLLAGFSGVIAVPQVGQRVVISKDSNGVEYVEGVLTGTDDPAPSVKEGEFVLQFDPSTRVRVLERDDGGFDVSIQSSGDVDVKASGDIRIGENGEKVAKQNHTHEYEDTGDSGTGGSSPTTKTSSTPNETGTETIIK